MADWSDDEDLSGTDQRLEPPADLPSALRQMQFLGRKLAQAHRDMAEYRSLVDQQFDANSMQATSPKGLNRLSKQTG
jgi:protein arginine N-methyltransferase 3